ncbi:MAG: cobalamin-dependent protein [Firmicutes bacterium]|jgi:methanogenic corrinoid protein MtbC1|nr:cobalamin-dependent protein [Bacillota bacterium]
MIEKMILESKKLFYYDDIVADEYEKSGEKMLEYVNKSMKEKANILTLLGGNPISLMEENHRNHLQFMSTVIKHKQGDLLVNTLPWVYKTYSSKGVEFPYFLYELSEWIKAIQDHVAPDCQKPLIDIYTNMISWHDKLIILSQETTENANQTNDEWTEDHEKIIKFLLLGDFKNIMYICSEKLKSGLPITKLYLDFIQPVMYKVGQLWQDGSITVAHEHLATSIIAQVIASLYPDYVLNDLTKGVAIMSAGINEYHQIGARIVADVLEHDGWDIRYLGANIPSDQLIELVGEVEPVFVGISITMSYHADKLVETVNLIRNLDSNKPIKIMVGGLAINNSVELQKLVDADAFPKNAEESVELARNWWKEYSNYVE